MGRLTRENGTQYTYDTRGNRAAMTTGADTTLYEYDRNNRLTKESRGNIRTDYRYDANGNLTTRAKGVISGGAGAEELTLGETDGESLSLAGAELTVYSYDTRDRLTGVQSDNGMAASYSYGADNMRRSKTVNGVTTRQIWDNGRIAGERNASGEITAKYYYGNAILASDAGEGVEYYQSDSHGDISEYSGNTYTYDAFGNRETAGAEDTNPFGYCGEYYDRETGMIYLRNRYYDPETGRFISEDPVIDGVDWYVYCSNDPINRIDPLGLFDYNTRLSYSQTYNKDVEVLQNELAWLGYLDMSSGGWGYYGSKTQAAVNAYKNDVGLGNTGKDKGVVGLQTWTSLGLIYRTQADIDTGVQIVMGRSIGVGGRTQYKDITVPLNKELSAIGEVAETKWSTDFPWFISQVNHGAPWDIKRKEPWEKTIKSTFPGSYDTKVVLFGKITTPEKLGNITYGYIGAAMGMGMNTLKTGSWVAAGLPMRGDAWANEYSDWTSIQEGYDWWHNGR